MKISYYPDTDSLYVELSEKPGADVVQISDDVVVDVDEDGNPVGIDISAGAREIGDLSELLLERVEGGDRASLKMSTSFMLRTVETTRETNVG
ncbi:MAG: DUF2283 domain-containing protein [Rubrobacter sp.]